MDRDVLDASRTRRTDRKEDVTEPCGMGKVLRTGVPWRTLYERQEKRKREGWVYVAWRGKVSDQTVGLAPRNRWKEDECFNR